MNALVITGVALLLLTVTVAVHELGHLWAAVVQGVRVTSFNIFVGPKLVSFTYRGIVFALRLIPLGGFVNIPRRRFLSEDELKEAEETGAVFLDDLSAPRQVFVLIAGCAMNLLFAFCVLTVLVSTYGQKHVEDRLVVGSVVEGSVAASAGVRAEDRLVGVWGQEVTSWADIDKALSEHQDPNLVLLLQRGEERLAFSLDRNRLTPYRLEYGSDGFSRDCLAAYGIHGARGVITYERKDLLEAAKLSAFKSATVMLAAVVVPYYLLPEMLRDRVAGKPEEQAAQEGSEIQAMGGFVTAALDEGMPGMLFMLVLINWSVMLFNIMPLPMLDGGHIVSVTAMAVMRRLIPQQRAQRVQQLVDTAFVLLGLLLMLYILAGWVI